MDTELLEQCWSALFNIVNEPSFGIKQILTYFSRLLTLTSGNSFFVFVFKDQHHFEFRIISYGLMKELELGKVIIL